MQEHPLEIKYGEKARVAGIAQFLGKLLPAICRLAADCSKKLKVGEAGRKGEGTGAKGNMLRKHNKRPLPCMPSDGLE